MRVRGREGLPGLSLEALAGGCMVVTVRPLGAYEWAGSRNASFAAGQADTERAAYAVQRLLDDAE